MTLRYSTDTYGAYTKNFYADVFGNMGTGYLGTGQSVSTWIQNNTTGTTTLFSNTGAAITGWTTIGTVTFPSTGGNTGYCIYLGNATAGSGNNGIYYGPVNIGSFLNKTLIFDIKNTVAFATYVYFACNSSGLGNGFVLNSNGPGGTTYYSGLAYSAATFSYGLYNTSVLAANGTTTGANTYNTWYSIKIVISSTGLATWYASTTGQSGTFTQQPPLAGFQITNSGTYMGFSGDSVGSSTIDNVYIYDNVQDYAYVTKWYNQGMDASFNSATQYTTTLQPIYDVINGLINFGYAPSGDGTVNNGNVPAPQIIGFFNLPDRAYPGISASVTTDASYAYVLRHGNLNNGTSTVALFSGGQNVLGKANSLIINANSLTGYYYNWWSGNDLKSTASSTGNNNVVSTTYNSTGSTGMGTRTFYLNGNFNTSGTDGTAAIHLQDPGYNYIGNCQYSGYAASSQFQMYNFFFFNSALTTTTDRQIIEATPYQYSVPPTIIGLSASQVTSTTFVLNWTAVANATFYILWINGSAYGPVTATGTVTPTTSGPWTLNLYAYNSSNVLLATGSTGAVLMAGAFLTANTGATQTTNGANTVFTFTSSGTFTPATTGYASVLIVGGGGYGGTDQGSGGGAGGLVYYDSNYKPMLLTAGTAYTVTVGTGGVNSTSTVATNSSFNSVIATAGGSGGGNGSVGVAGGSSSGCGTNSTTTAASTQVSYASAYFVGGNIGGTSTGTNGSPTSGGGGGAGGPGGNSNTSAPLTGGSGGVGYQSNIYGTNVYYSGGGGGMGSAVGGIGGSGIGGTGGTNNVNGGVGGNATGYGSGGGAGVGGGVRGGNGSAGVVIISCQGLTAIAGIAATSVTATNFVLSWTTVATYSYILWINGINYGAVTTGSTITPTITGPWTLGLYGYNASNVLVYYGTWNTALDIFNITAGTFSSIIAYRTDSIGVNDAGTKIVGGNYNGGAIIYFYTYWNGTSWTTPTSIGTVTGCNQLNGALTADGTRGVIGNNWFSWTGTTPSALTSFGSAPSGGRGQRLTADGSRLLMLSAGTMGFYTWNGTTYANFVSLASLTNLNSNSCVGISPDGSYIFYSSNSTNSNVYIATWNGTTYINERLNVSAAYNTFVASYPVTDNRDFCVGIKNVLYMNYWNSSYIFAIALAYNSATGYWDKFYNLGSGVGYGGGLSVPRIATTGSINLFYGGTLYSTTLTVT